MSSNKTLYLSLAKNLKEANADPFLATQSLLSTAQALGLDFETFKEVFTSPNEKAASPPPSRPRRVLSSPQNVVTMKKKEKAQNSELDKLLDESIFSPKIAKPYKKLLQSLKVLTTENFDPSSLDRANAAALVADIDIHLAQFQEIYEHCE